jgi:hypothetical protein
MKKYLFGLGAMLVGAGLMFVFTHTEVSAESGVERPDIFVCSEEPTYGLWHCKTKTLDCAYSNPNMSCVKKGLFK